MTNLRRFPRIPFTDAGELEVPVRRSDPHAGSQRLAVHFRTISCQGASLALGHGDALRVIPGAEVQLCFRAGERAIQLPARVVWTAGSLAGLRLRVNQADDDTRRAYADWIVPLTNEAIAQSNPV